MSYRTTFEAVAMLYSPGRAVGFFEPCIPPVATAQGSSRIMKRSNGQMFVGKSSNSKASKSKEQLTRLFEPHAPDTPLEGAIKMNVYWCRPWRKSEPKKNRKNGDRPCITRPDVDNLQKLLLDTLTALEFWGDDSQVYEITFTKVWGDKPGIGILLREKMEEEDYEEDW